MAPGLMGGFEPVLPVAPLEGEPDDKQEDQGDPHLRSTREVMSYAIQARDADIGHVDDFILDDESWVIRYLVIDTGNWWPGKKVLVAPQWISEVSWDSAAVSVNLTQNAIKTEPEYDPSRPLTREDEVALYAKYQQTPYWEATERQ